MNIFSAIKEGTNILNKKLIKSAKLDSEILIAKAINRDRKYILLNPNNIVSEKHLFNYRKFINERSNRKPIAQITNTKFFWNSEFVINENTLIPRPETELIIENVLKFTKNKKKLNILDIGIGSGCILVSIQGETKFLWYWNRY